MYPYRITTIGDLEPGALSPSTLVATVRANPAPFAVVGLLALVAGVAIGRAGKKR